MHPLLRLDAGSKNYMLHALPGLAILASRIGPWPGARGRVLPAGLPPPSDTQGVAGLHWELAGEGELHPDRPGPEAGTFVPHCPGSRVFLCRSDSEFVPKSSVPGSSGLRWLSARLGTEPGGAKLHFPALALGARVKPLDYPQSGLKRRLEFSNPYPPLRAPVNNLPLVFEDSSPRQSPPDWTWALVRHQIPGAHTDLAWKFSRSLDTPGLAIHGSVTPVPKSFCRVRP